MSLFDLARPIAPPIAPAVNVWTSQSSAGMTPQLILGSNLLADWDGRFGLTIAATTLWVDQVGSRVISCTTSAGASFGADTAGTGLGFGLASRPVARLTVTGAGIMDTGAGGSTLIPAGSTGFYLSAVMRMSQINMPAQQRFIELLDSGATNEIAQLRRNTTASGGSFVGHWNPTPDLALGTHNTTVHLWELFISGGDLVRSLDGVDLAAGATGVVTAADLQRVSIGAFPGPIEPADIRIARIRICAAVPTAEQRVQLRNLDRAIWNAP